MKAAVDEWADFSAQQLENRLDRIWKQKQKEVKWISCTIIVSKIEKESKYLHLNHE